ncbi:NO-associated protein 1, chloroplastic/mitochondrial isoform X5 [Prunus dulcis]|uniref:NO-associated protein 1, chloroplastic/mitochondrial isoform X5 n=1 Tax=Prunus dulcis TaxID=3755 RepID=UPI00148337D5|nr:NO-associated protein 1, chloroplastic/mitochondrial isoform X5 [Prunus dulcis]
MAPKTLSSFLSPFTLPYHLTIPKTKLLNLHSESTLIFCRFSQPQKTHQKATVSENQSLDPPPEPDGTGAAAPTPGDRFLERHRSFEAAKVLLKEKKQKKKEKPVKVSTNVACCYGCGAPLQTSEPDAPGYSDPETYALKKKHHQLKTVICGRCKLLSHGHMITAVGGNGGYSGGKQFIMAEQLREKLAHLRHERALIVKLVDIVDFNGSFLARVRDLAGANPIILVITKGSANVGKSAFISALLKMMAENDPVAASAQKYKPIQSAVPGTTLGPIQINAFLGGGKLYDTPGVHLHHRQAAVVHSEDLPALAPQSRLRGQSFPVCLVSLGGYSYPVFVSSGNGIAGNDYSNGLNGYSIFWGGLVRVDVLKVLPETRLTFYGPKSLQIHMVPSDKADEFYQKELGVLLTPPTGKQRADEWRGLETERQLQIKFEDVERPACDVAISGLGWITVEPLCKSSTSSDSRTEAAAGELHLAVHVPKPVEIFVRPPLPVGKSGAEWYQYRELTEKEEEVRPKWHF